MQQAPAEDVAPKASNEEESVTVTQTVKDMANVAQTMQNTVKRVRNVFITIFFLESFKERCRGTAGSAWLEVVTHSCCSKRNFKKNICLTLRL